MFNYLKTLIPPLYERGAQFVGFIHGVSDEFKKFTEGAESVSEGWITLNAGTYALEVLGGTVGLTRPDWADNELYRKLIIATYAALNSNGAYGDVARILDILQDTEGSVVIPIYPAAIDVNLVASWFDESKASTVSNIIETGMPSGVGYNAYWSDVPYFSWQEDPHPMAGTWTDPWIKKVS